MAATFMIVVTVLAVLGWVEISETMRYCTTDDNCVGLGKLKCIKSYCNWGMCGCERGSVSRYMGSEKLLQCVPQHKVGESCSTDKEDGVCGAPNSYCRNGTCSCPHGWYSLWNGEMCDIGTIDLYPGEMSSGDSRAACKSGTSASSYYSFSSFTPRNIINFNPQICDCAQGYKTVFPNFFTATFQGKKIPQCTPLVIGDTCIVDGDCNQIVGNTKCGTSNKCECMEAGDVANIEGSRCGPALTFGQNCSLVGGSVCDGSLGLTCGDACSTVDPYPLDLTEQQCGCHYTRIRNQQLCVERNIGSECFGDMNCKEININAICVDGSCQNGAKDVGPVAVLVALCMSCFVFMW